LRQEKFIAILVDLYLIEFDENKLTPMNRNGLAVLRQVSYFGFVAFFRTTTDESGVSLYCENARFPGNGSDAN